MVGFILSIPFLFADKVPFLNETLGKALRSNQGFLDIVILMLLVLAVIVGVGAGQTLATSSGGNFPLLELAKVSQWIDSESFLRTL